MASPPIRTERFADPQIARMQKSVEQATQQSRECPLIDGVPLRNIALPASLAVDVPHKLGRAWVGCIVTKTPSQLAVIAQAPNQTDPTKFITLVTTVSVTIDVWVF